MNRVDNAIIMAAGTSSRFAPLSFEKPKALIEVKGEVLIERQIRQLKEAGVPEIYVVTGYKAEAFRYLQGKYGVRLLHNPEYNTRNNNASIKAAEDVLNNSYVCSADNYFLKNPFEREVGSAYYAAVFSQGPTKEWCIQSDENDVIRGVTIGGENSWYMLGHTFWDTSFSAAFCRILDEEYDRAETADKLWEDIYIEHLDELTMKIRKYPNDFIFEFDSLDELRKFDSSYKADTHSVILKKISYALGIGEEDIRLIAAFKNHSNEAAGFTFRVGERLYRYTYQTGKMECKGGE